MAGEVDLNESRITAVTVCYSIPIPFMILFTGLRLFIKIRPSSKNGMHFDDYMIIFATVSGNLPFVLSVFWGDQQFFLGSNADSRQYLLDYVSVGWFMVGSRG